MKQFFINIWEKWKIIAHKIGRFNTKVILTLVYFLIISPIGLLFKLFGWNPLDNNFTKENSSNWKETPQSDPDLESMKKQS